MTENSDVYYRPLSDGVDWLRAWRLQHLLVLGEPDETQAAWIGQIPAAEIRVTGRPNMGVVVHDGLYAHDTPQGSVLVMVLGHLSPIAADDGRRRLGGHLGQSHEIYEDEWRGASTMLDSSAFAPGAMVRSRSARTIGRVRSIKRGVDNHLIEVDFGTATRTFDSNDLELVEGDPSRPDFWLKQLPADKDAIASTLSWIKLRYPLTDMLYSFATSKTTFKPYQFLPVLKILRSATNRLLIADEVGLGKTIEAGLIWTEIEQRNPMRRALIVVPSALRFKWKQEMSRRFMRELDILKKDDLHEFADKLEDGQDPDLLGIISMESIRSDPELLERLSSLQPDFQLIIFDEAHVLRNPSTKSHAVGSVLAELTEYLVLLSATPLNLGENDLFTLVKMLAPGEFQDLDVFTGQLKPNAALNAASRHIVSHQPTARQLALTALSAIPGLLHGRPISQRADFQRLLELLQGDGVLTHAERAAARRMLGELNTLSGVLNRTRKVDLPDKKAIRVAEQVEVEWTPLEQTAYDLIHEASFERARTSGLPSGFVTQMPLRQASSCLPIAWAKLQDRSWDVEDDTSLDAFADELTADQTSEAFADVQQAVRLSSLSLGVDSKLETLRDRLRQAKAEGLTQVLIFSFFKGTVEYLGRNLSNEYRTAVLHGGVKPDQRERVIDDFRSGKIDILIANQVASEGLDFQFCNVLVNYDLPWNPMQVEQRIGRLDRFGQKHDKIFIFNMHVPGTIEANILARLHDRIGVFERSIGDLEPILRSEVAKVRGVLLDPFLSPEEKATELDRIAVAVQKREHDVTEIEESSDILTSVDQLEVEGLTVSGPSNGRYVGKAEVERLLAGVIARHGGTLGPSGDTGVAVLKGSPALARALSDATYRVKPPHPGLGRLIGDVRDGIPVRLAFQADVLEQADAELVSTRHPLIRLAISELAGEPTLTPRFGAVALRGLSFSRRALVRIDIAHTEGIRSSRELWITALNLQTLERDLEIEEQLLVQLANDTFSDVDTPAALPTNDALHILESYLADRQSAARRERAQDNTALAEARRTSDIARYDRQITDAKLLLAEATAARGSEDSIARLRRGHLRKLEERRSAALIDHQSRERFALSVEWAATLHVQT